MYDKQLGGFGVTAIDSLFSYARGRTSWSAGEFKAYLF